MAGLRQALRALGRQPGSAAVVIVTLAVSIAATTIIASLVEFLLHAIPVADPSRLAMVSSTDPRPSQAQSGMSGGVALSGTSVPDLVDWSARSRTIDEFIAFRYDSATMRATNVPERVRVVRTTANLPTAFGFQPAAGRLFRAEEGRAGASGVVLLSDRFWRRRFDARAGVVGSSLTLDGAPHAVAGVLAPSVSRGIFMDVDLFVATPLDAARSAREERRLFVFGRLQPGATIDQASAELSSIAADLRRRYPTTNAQTGAVVRPLLEQLGGNIAAIVGIMALIAALIVATACANVSNVMLALGGARRRELSIRSALGAGRLEHVRRLMLEATVLGTAAGALGLLLGASGLSGIKWFAGPESRLLSGTAMNVWVLATGVLVSFVLPFAFGLLPAFNVSKPDAAGLNDGARTIHPGSRRLRTALTALQVGLAVILMVQIAIMGRRLLTIESAPLGFDPTRTLAFTLELPESRGLSAERLRTFERQVVAQLDALPQVVSATLTSHVPIGDREQIVPVTIDNRPARTPAEMPTTAIVAAGLDYFSTLRVPVEEGRVFTAADVGGGPPAVVVSGEAARRFWPGQSAVGRTLTVRADGWPATPLRVVGIVRDVRPAEADARVGPQVYVPWSWHPERRMRFLVRTTAVDPLSLVPAIRGRVAVVEPDEPIFDASSMKQILYGDVASEYVLSVVFTVIALIALGVAAVGVYGLVAHDVTQRTREIGLRLALGAAPGRVIRMVLSDGTRPVLYGGVVGLAAAIALAFATAATFLGNARDPIVYVVVVLMVSFAALAASYVPARRASHIDPVDALRAD
jgi:putative ABC transport system permease protein